MKLTNEIEFLKNEIRMMKKQISRLLIPYNAMESSVRNMRRKKNLVPKSQGFHDWMVKERKRARKTLL